MENVERFTEHPAQGRRVQDVFVFEKDFFERLWNDLARR